MYASSSDTFYKYYAQAQRGGALGSVDGIPVFKASRRHVQGGAGLGDMLRSAFRWFLPVAMRGASTFANQFLKSHEQGSSFKDAAKSAIGPTLGVAGDAIKSRIEARAKQQEADKAAAVAAAAPAAAAAAGAAPAGASKAAWSSWFGKQSGSGRKRRRVYKGGRKAKRKTTKRKQVGQGRRKRKAKKQVGGKRKTKKQSGGKKRKSTKRRRRATPAVTSYNF